MNRLDNTNYKGNFESYLYNNISNDIDSMNIIDNYRKSEKLNKERISLHLKNTFNTFYFMNLQGMLNEPIFNMKLIMEKEFNIFELEKIVGHQKVLPMMGRTMLD